MRQEKQQEQNAKLKVKRRWIVRRKERGAKYENQMGSHGQSCIELECHRIALQYLFHLKWQFHATSSPFPSCTTLYFAL
jgi:hypothetical protein